MRDSIAATGGPMLPIVVREIDDPENPGEKAFGLIDGLQRYTCCSDLKIPTIPARVIDMDEANVAAAQIIANHSRIDTKPVEYTRQLHRMLNANPTMTLEELSEQLHVSVKWLKDRLSLANLHEDLGQLVDDGHIALAHAFVLAKIKPAEEQKQFAEQAQTQGIQEFTGHVNNHIKALREQARTGKEGKPEEWAPVPHLRPTKEIKQQLENLDAANVVCEQVGATTPEDGFRAGIQWVLNMDPKTVERLRQEHEDRKKAEADRKAKVAAEKAEKRAAEARAKAAEVGA
jgi:ParB/RepB/Spo0J family partition protein